VCVEQSPNLARRNASPPRDASQGNSCSRYRAEPAFRTSNRTAGPCSGHCAKSRTTALHWEIYPTEALPSFLPMYAAAGPVPCRIGTFRNVRSRSELLSRAGACSLELALRVSEYPVGFLASLRLGSKVDVDGTIDVFLQARLLRRAARTRHIVNKCVCSETVRRICTSSGLGPPAHCGDRMLAASDASSSRTELTELQGRRQGGRREGGCRPFRRYRPGADISSSVA
jgi:hypothetical protein